jgi:hypothetical protein
MADNLRVDPTRFRDFVSSYYIEVLKVLGENRLDYFLQKPVRVNAVFAIISTNGANDKALLAIHLLRQFNLPQTHSSSETTRYNCHSQPFWMPRLWITATKSYPAGPIPCPESTAVVKLQHNRSSQMDWQTFSAQWGFNYAFWVATAVAVISILISLWLRTRSRLAFDRRSSTIVGQNKTAFSKMIKIMFDGKEIPRGTVSTFTIWNDGNKTIRRADITPKRPLMLKVPDGEQILQASVYSVADDAMDVSVVLATDTTAAVSFEYIEPKRGFICEVFHTGSANDITFDGILIEAGQPRQKEIPGQHDGHQSIFSMIAVCFMIPLIARQVISSQQWENVGWPSVLIFSFFGLFFLIVLMVAVTGIYAYFTTRQIKLGRPQH